MHQPPSPGPPFPTRLAFVVQFSAATAVEGERSWAGSSMSSRGRAPFHTLDELWAFMRRVLATQTSIPEAPL